LSGQTIGNGRLYLVKPLEMENFVWSNHWKWQALPGQTIGNEKLYLVISLEMASFVWSNHWKWQALNYFLIQFYFCILLKQRF
jgi:hypothetical protein